jgi:hypothetical protein
MNLYDKLQTARVELQSSGIKKSGNNKFAGYTYHELSDFLPTINNICLKHKLFTQITFDHNIATLRIINAEQPEESITFTSPMAEAQLKGCHQIQNLGAVQTYQRRYLYMMAFEIVECDALDASIDTTSKSAKPAQQEQPVNWPAFWAAWKKLGLTEEDAHKAAGCDSITHFSRAQANELMAKGKIIATERKGA